MKFPKNVISQFINIFAIPIFLENKGITNKLFAVNNSASQQRHSIIPIGETNPL